MILSPEVFEQTLINLTATEMAPLPQSTSVARPDYETGNQRNQRISYEMHSQWNQSIISRGFHDNVSVNSKPDHHSGQPRGFARSHCLGGGGGGDFESEKFSTVFKDKCRNFSICFRGTGGSLKSKCSCALSCHLLQNSRCLRRGSRPNFEWVPSRIQKFRNAAKRRTDVFLLLGGSGGMLPQKILKFKHLRLVEIAFPSNIL